jgi:alpha-beta hydrolase superfamily lysophospholipase
MPYIYHIPMLPAAIPVIAFLIGMSGPEAGADETGVKSRFEEHSVEFHNQAVNLAGSLLLPKSEIPLPAVVLVHGAGRHTRESQREVGEYFANHGIASLIYDKRGTGKSGGAYESHEPYENLINDALSAVAFLKQRRAIAESQIGIWGLSQGAYISAAAASQTEDVKFVITVGALVADGQIFYYRDNLFRLYGLSDTLRDIAEKAHLAQRDLHRTLQDGFHLSSFATRSYSPPDQYLHPAWSNVDQPVLAMWGELDQNVPVGESVAGLKNSLVHANNEKWTIIILPKANHDLGISETGSLQSKWLGYAPGALKTMTDWVQNRIDHPFEIHKMKQEGIAREAGILSRFAGYEKLRWYGNATVQTACWILFFVVFLTNTIVGIRRCTVRLIGRASEAALPGLDGPARLKRVVCVLNLLILVAFTITVLLVADQLRPSCPSALLFLPILGTVSTLATIVLLIVLAWTRNDPGWTKARSVRGSLELLCLILFVPFMLYWNLIGYRF